MGKEKKEKSSLTSLAMAEAVFNRQLLLSTAEDEHGNHIKAIEMELAGLRHLVLELVRLVETHFEK